METIYIIITILAISYLVIHIWFALYNGWNKEHTNGKVHNKYSDPNWWDGKAEYFLSVTYFIGNKVKIIKVDYKTFCLTDVDTEMLIKTY